MEGKSSASTIDHRPSTEWIKVAELNVGDEIAVPREISGRVWSLSADDDRHRALSEQRPLLQKYQLKPQSFILSFWLDKESNKEKYNSQCGQDDSQPSRKVDKKFACQSHSKYSFRNICQITRSKFSTSSFYNFHHSKIYHLLYKLSRLFSVTSAQASTIYQPLSQYQDRF